jgi:hypothetical protein
MSPIGDDPVSRLFPHPKTTTFVSLILLDRHLLDLRSSCFPRYFPSRFLEFVTVILSCRRVIDFTAAATRWLQKSSRKSVLFYVINFRLTSDSLNPTVTIKTGSSCIQTVFHTNTMKVTEVLVCVSYSRPFAVSPAEDRSSVRLTMSCHRPQIQSKTAKSIIAFPLTQPARMAVDYKLIPWMAMH